ncbi:MAG: TonB family protein [Arenimonas sp.]|nr:TonB family protein [Arenimonas sp.]
MNTINDKKVNLRYVGLIFTICFSLVACSNNDADKKAADAAKTAVQKPQSSIDRLVKFPEKDLRANASKAVIEQRWYKPSGNNALEYYLALKMKLKTPDEGIDTALADIMPYAVIGMDQAIANFDDKEALRIEGLIRLVDPYAPALSRVKGDLEKMKARQAQATTELVVAEQESAEKEAKDKADAEKAKLEAAKKAKEDAAKADATPAAPAVQAPAPVVQAPAPVVQAPAPVAQAPAPAPAANKSVVAISTPQPPYPKEALASGAKGEVVAELTINEIGEVTNVRIISAKPTTVFNKTVTNTLRKWRFQGNGQVTTLRRNFVFN